MVKHLIVNPDEVRRPGATQIGEIPANTYSGTLADEIAGGALNSAEALLIYRDMAIIREFETMLDQVKKMGSYQGLEYDHKGPAHLSIGQEAAAVGQAFLLGANDHIFGSHRSHGEFLAKGLSAIHKLPPEELDSIIEGSLDGEIWNALKSEASEDRDVRAEEFLIFGLLAEIFGRATGFNRGLGGSMHAFFLPFGTYPNNAIVGGSADIAVGSAMFMRLQQQEGIAVANIGDASSGCGPVWEAMNFATMGQLWNLWPEPYQGGLPVIFSFMNNFYGMGGQTRGETMGFERLACLGAGVNRFNLHAETIDGNNPLAVIDAFRRKKEVIKKGEGPVLLEVIAYRQSGHSPSDASAYREREEIEMWRSIDPLKEYGKQLLESSTASEEDLSACEEHARTIILKAYQLATDLEISPRLGGDPIARFMFCHQDEDELPGIREGDVLKPLEENSRVQALAEKSRSGIDPETGAALPETKAISYRDALFEPIIHHFYKDHRLVAYGEENRDWDGAFAVYRGMTESLPYHRLFNSPISEAAIAGTAVGYGMEGGRALVELMYCDFLGRAGDEIFNQLAKWQGMSGGEIKMPVVVRVSVGSKYGAQHSQDWSALVAHIPGLKVCFPVTPYDAKGLMASALSGNDPVIFFESQRVYGETEKFRQEVPSEYYKIPIGEPDIKRDGNDLTILTVGATLYRAVDTARTLENDYGISTEIIDARSLVPFDYSLVLDSVRKTGRILLASDACERGSYLNTLATNIQQMAFDHLDAPVSVVGARNWITPSAEQEDLFFPGDAWLLDAIHTHLLPLDGYTPSSDRSNAYMIRCNREGV
ncbi:MAG: thiamine pyrophosphate-dependent enzyme [Planctomycetota bacterium]|nr:thiamine pyrophosphate-dependent enzyme [Planctomycetota bacterium]